MMSPLAGLSKNSISSFALLPRISSKPPVPPVPWHWKQFDASSRPSVLDGCAIVVAVVEVPRRTEVICAVPVAAAAVDAPSATVSPPPPGPRSAPGPARPGRGRAVVSLLVGSRTLPLDRLHADCVPGRVWIRAD
jgi:hypothetical protein